MTIDKDHLSLTHEVVRRQYETLMKKVNKEYSIETITYKKHLIYLPQASKIRASSSKHDGCQSATFSAFW
jgi:hypothetical protein